MPHTNMTRQNGCPSVAVKRILLVEDHASFRQMLAFICDREPDFSVVAQAGSLAEARTQLDGIDLAVVDLTLPDGSGLDLIKDVRKTNPESQVLVLTSSLERTDLARVVEAGAAGMLHKSTGIDDLIGTIRRVIAGEALLSLEEIITLLRLASEQRRQEHDAKIAIGRLTVRERQVIEGLAAGLDSKEIAQQLGISVETERTHMDNILTKLGLHSRLQALVFAVRHGVVPLPQRPVAHQRGM